MILQKYKMNCKFFLSYFAILFLFASQVVNGQSIELGESLYSSNCASCHYVGPESKKLIGPGLGAHTLDEHPREWLYKWIKNSNALIESGDERAIAVYEEYNKVAMTAFPYFSNEDIDNILAYISAPPKEVVVQESELVTSEVSSSDNTTTILTFILVTLLIFIFVLARLKNVLKELKGEETQNLFSTTYIWLKSNPSFIVLLIIIGLSYGCRSAWDGLLNIGVQQGYQPDQPIAFSHKIHAGENAVDCNYCHSGARESKSAGVPSANVCMNCHTYINEGRSEEGTQEISKIYQAIGFDPETKTYIEGYEQIPIEWIRIHNLPDLAYFNHSQHVTVGGVECQTCHGPIQEMEVVEQYSPLTMGWCINCHRETQVDTTNNYYHDLNEGWIEKYHGEEITAAKIGGLECGKCHY